MLRQYLSLFLFTFIAVCVQAANLEITKTPTFIDPKNIPFETLPPPVAANSDAQSRDMHIVMWEQNSRTIYDIERAWGSVTLEPSYFNEALGVRFEEARYPKLYAIMKTVMNDARIFVDAFKVHYQRPRPYQDSKDVKPVIPVEESYTYPSGHGTRGMTLALVYAELFPKQKEALLKTGLTLGQDRVIGGVHYPSDIEASVILAQALAKNIIASPTFKTQIKDAQDEIVQIKAMQK